MGEVLQFVSDQFSSIFSSSLALSVLVFSVVLTVASLFIWQFYKSTSKRNLIELDLRKYNRSEHPLTSKFLAIVLYLLEYIIIMPVLIILWFAALSVVLLMVANERTVNEVLLISAALVGSIRILAYYHNEISKDLAKLFPFMALSLFLLSPGALKLDLLSVHVNKIPLLLSSTFSFVLVVVVIEIILRVVFTFVDLWKSEDGELVGDEGEEE
jgi:hypothetical protein